jgi:hypothetical protein
MERLGLLITALSLATAVCADVIYDDQTYNPYVTWNAYSIHGGNGYETADDFETTADWTLEMVRFWVIYSGIYDVRVDIFNDSGAGPGTPLFHEEVPSGEITWTLVDDPGYTIYKVKVPISGFDIDAGTRYWLGLQRTSGSNAFWLVMPNEPDWWENCYFYDGAWYDSADYFGEASACEFELHGTPADAAVEPASFGAIKAGFAE